MRILLLILLSLANIACSQKIESQQADDHVTPIEYDYVVTEVFLESPPSSTPKVSPKIDLQSDTHLSGQSGYAYKLKISDQEELIFLNYIKDYKLYSEPRLSRNGVISKIEGYEGYDDVYAGIYSIDFKISENKHYVEMDTISNGYVGTSQELNGNYQCIIIDIKNSKVVRSGVDMCDGEWKDNQWISQGKVEFDGK
ncbi:hypothetical protein [uncultured Gilliamella sp.]|uniref:hypothetical protein n=1 Tax=uncultured Gilliamella sp. TaxID=1193505 RepID=UPI0025FBFAA3|nr:hypothetical protein [uncultured Gilliamella sp.]